MSAAKSPAELIADLTDQVRLLRQDVGNLTATATTKAEAAKLRASVQKITIDALEQNRQIGSTAAEMSRRMHRDSLTAAQEAAGQAVRGLEDKISAAANHMRLESVKGRQQALYSFGGGLGRLRGNCGPGSRSGHRDAASDPGTRRCTFIWKKPGPVLHIRRGRARNPCQ
jgi:hypothetical protein